MTRKIGEYKLFLLKVSETAKQNLYTIVNTIIFIMFTHTFKNSWFFREKKFNEIS